MKLLLLFLLSSSQCFNMNGQKCMKDFFKPVLKRNNTESNVIMNLSSDCRPLEKKQKTIIDKENNAYNSVQIKTEAIECGNISNLTSTGETLTQEQKIRCENNRLAANLLSYSNKYQILNCNMDRSWFKALENEFNKPYFKKLNQFIISERGKGQIFPPEDKVWTWTSCSVEDVKVVIIGQDPYHHPGQAHGLCFSVPEGVRPPPSLLNIYKELESDIKGFEVPKHGNLIGWVRQGVLLLNSVLTVKSYTPNSHKDRGWEELTTAAIKHLSDHTEGIVFLLWGAYAQKKANVVNKNKHHLLSSVHPSPLSAHRGFIGCHHFSRCNELLLKQNKTAIDWNSLPKV